MSFSKKFILILSSIILLIISIFVLIGAINSRPTNFVKDYFRIASVGDYRRLYDYIDLSDYKGMTRDEFVQKSENYVEKNKIKKEYIPKFKIKKVSELSYEISFLQDSNEKVVPLKLKKQQENQWLFFKKFKALP